MLKQTRETERIRKVLAKRKLFKTSFDSVCPKHSKRIQEQKILNCTQGVDQCFLFLHFVFQSSLPSFSSGLFPSALVDLIYIYYQSSYDIRSIQCIQQINSHNGNLVHISFLPSQNLFCITKEEASSTITTQIWKEKSSSPSHSFENIRSKNFNLYAYGGFYIFQHRFLIMQDQYLYIYDVNSLEEIAKYKFPFSHETTSILRFIKILDKPHIVSLIEEDKSHFGKSQNIDAKTRYKLILYDLEKESVSTNLFLPTPTVYFFVSEKEILLRNFQSVEIWDIQKHTCVAFWYPSKSFIFLNITELFDHKLVIHVRNTLGHCCEIWDWKAKPFLYKPTCSRRQRLLYSLPKKIDIDCLIGNIEKEYFVFLLKSKRPQLHIYQYIDQIKLVHTIQLQNFPITYWEINANSQIIVGYENGLIEILSSI